MLLGSLTIPGEPAYLHAARKLVARTLGNGYACSDTAAPLTSELVTNALQHSDSRHLGGTVTISVIAVPDGIRVEVIDDGGATLPAVDVKQPEQPCLAERGRGLRLVDSLSARWSHYTDTAGAVTWFELKESPDD